MKKTLLTLAIVGFSAAAFAQGKVALAWDLPVTFGAASQMLAADVGLANTAVPTGTGSLPSAINLYIGLYGGTSSSSLSLISGELLNGGSGLPAGAFTRLNMLAPMIAPGAVGFFQVKIWDAAYATYEAQALAGRVGNGTDYAAYNNVFSMTTGASISYPQIYNGGNTTWATVGNENVNSLLLVTQPVPEPTTFALAGLGAAALLIFRRRK